MGSKRFTAEQLREVIKAGAQTRAEVATKMGCSTRTVDLLLKAAGIELKRSGPLHDARRQRTTEAARLFISGKAQGKIAEDLDVSERTVKDYLVAAGLMPSQADMTAHRHRVSRRMWHNTDLYKKEIAVALRMDASAVSRYLKDEPPRGEWKENA